MGGSASWTSEDDRMNKPQVDPFKIYLHAWKFLWSEEHLRRTDNPQVMAFVVPPAIVLSAFTSELLLKCILMLEKGDAPNTHDLKILFDQVSTPIQQKIIAGWDQTLPGKEKEFAFQESLSGRQIPRDLPTALAVCGRAFEGMRYIYEDPMKTNFYLIELARILLGAIWEIKPEWKNIRPGPAREAVAGN